MAIATQNRTIVEGNAKYKVVYETKCLFGIIKWFKRISTDKIGVDLIIITEENFDKIYLNGREITPINLN